ncbi:MAG TPA: hypothetical protein VH418_16050 [Solirubrobacteraceae bacterium]
MSWVLPSDPQPGPLRRLLHHLRLANRSDDRLRRPAASAAPLAKRTLPTEQEGAAPTDEVGPSAAERVARTALVDFGLSEDPQPDRRSRYGELSTLLDRDIDALRAHVADLETRVDALRPSADDPPREA